MLRAIAALLQGLHDELDRWESTTVQDVEIHATPARQLGELVGVTQQQIASYEIGRRRIPVSNLPLLAKALDVSIEALIGGSTKAASKRGPAPKLQQQLEQLSRLSKTQRRLVSQLIDTVLQQHGS